MRLNIFIICLGVLLSGCQTINQHTERREQAQEDIEMLTTVAESISGKEISEEEMKRIARELRTDEEARSAVEAITGSISGEPQIIKYCPKDGERYAASFVECPKHFVELKILD